MADSNPHVRKSIRECGLSTKFCLCWLNRATNSDVGQFELATRDFWVHTWNWFPCTVLRFFAVHKMDFPSGSMYNLSISHSPQKVYLYLILALYLNSVYSDWQLLQARVPSLILIWQCHWFNLGPFTCKGADLVLICSPTSPGSFTFASHFTVDKIWYVQKILGQFCKSKTTLASLEIPSDIVFIYLKDLFPTLSFPQPLGIQGGLQP